MASDTINCLTNLIVLENVFCINRSYLIDSKVMKVLGNVLFFLTSVLIIASGIDYALTENVSLAGRMFQAFLAFEFINLAIVARVRRYSFVTLKRLDEKCGVSENYISQLSRTATKYSILTLLSAIVELVGLRMNNENYNEVFIYWIIYSAQDAELIFISMVVEAINLRLSKLRNASPVYGSQVYRHVLIAAATLNEEFVPQVMLMFAVILGTTVTYSSVVMLSDTGTGPHLLIYLIWRELKALFCLWRVCFASSKTKSICQQLALQLAKTLTLDPYFDHGKNPETYQTVHRWYCAALGEKPRLVSGSVLSMGLGVPLQVLDLSVNYVLIIVQIYIAYN